MYSGSWRGLCPLALFVRSVKRRYVARTIANRLESYSGPEVPLRWLCSSVGMDTKDIARYFENGYFANLSLDLNQKVVRKRTVPRYDPNRGRTFTAETERSIVYGTF